MPPGAFDVAWLGALDHFVGHLYPYHAGEADPDRYDETVACVNQHLAAQARSHRDPRFRVVAKLLPPVYHLHKNIPLSSYQKL